MTSHTSSPLITAIIVLYNPDHSVMENIESYIDRVDKVYVVDNSEYKNNFLIKELQKNKKIKYIDNKGNRGIAHALNVGADNAIKDGYNLLLTMDQDSKVTSNMISYMLPFLDKNNNAIVSPYHASQYISESLKGSDSSFVLTTMTSGNLLNLRLYKKIGPFREKLFIDYVDNEYCLRANKHGYKIVQVNNAILKHNLGNLRQHRILWKTFHSTNHSPIRRYYAFRNRIYMINTYKNDFPAYCKYERNRFFIDFIIVLIYEKEKLQKFKMMFLGIRDGLKNKYGKFHD